MPKDLRYFPISSLIDKEALESYLRAVNEEETYKGIVARVEDDQVIMEIPNELEDIIINKAITDVESAIRIAIAQKQMHSLFFPNDEEDPSGLS